MLGMNFLNDMWKSGFYEIRFFRVYSNRSEKQFNYTLEIKNTKYFYPYK